LRVAELASHGDKLPGFLLAALHLARGEASDTMLLSMAMVAGTLDSRYIPRACDVALEGGWWLVALRVVHPPLAPLSSTRRDALTAVRQVAEALLHLHGQGHVHLSLTASTVAVDASGTVQVYDLWGARLYRAENMVPSILSQRARTAYDAPEAGAEMFDGVKADIYSLGVLASELGLPERYASLVERMRHPSPRERPASMQAVLAELA
jgi:hypothetical protein